jgi:hypothetical protein
MFCILAELFCILAEPTSSLLAPQSWQEANKNPKGLALDRPNVSVGGGIQPRQSLSSLQRPMAVETHSLEEFDY